MLSALKFARGGKQPEAMTLQSSHDLLLKKKTGVRKVQLFSFHVLQTWMLSRCSTLPPGAISRQAALHGAPLVRQTRAMHVGHARGRSRGGSDDVRIRQLHPSTAGPRHGGLALAWPTRPACSLLCMPSIGMGQSCADGAPPECSGSTPLRAQAGRPSQHAAASRFLLPHPGPAWAKGARCARLWHREPGRP